MKAILPMFMAAALLGAGSPPATAPAAVRSVVSEALAAEHIPGIEIGVAVNGKLIFDAGFGVRNIRSAVAVTPGTRFEIGSITKQFTAAAILRLKEERKLKLSDPLGKYVPEYPLGKNITIEQLMWQVSGIPDYLNDVPNIRQIVMAHLGGGLHPALDAIGGRNLYFAPGTRWRYSDTNYLLLGAIVARVSHMSWEEYIRSYIFAPAGMTRSGFIGDEPQFTDMATGYTLADGQVKPTPAIPEGWAGAAGGIVSTAADLSRWDNAFFSGRIVSATDVLLATTPHRLPSGKSTGYGFGWFIDKVEGSQRLWHGGGTLGFGAINEYFPKLRESEIILSNTNADAATLIDAPVFEALHPELTDSSHRSAAGEDPTITELTAKMIRSMQAGKIDNSLLTAAFANRIRPESIERAKTALGSLGLPELSYIGKTSGRAATTYRYRVAFKVATLLMQITIANDGRVDSLTLSSE